jgi:hypothetical protein
MSRLSFIPRFIVWSLIIFFIFYVRKWSGLHQILFLLITLFIFYFFRRSSIPFRETIKSDGEIFLSPIHGVVKSIRRNTMGWDELPGAHEVRISMSYFDQKGLYLPTSGEVSYLKENKGLKVDRKGSSQDFYLPPAELAHTDLVLKSKNETKTLMRFIDCLYGYRPSIWLKSGDCGRGAACFGHYPFGGTLIIYLPKDSDILVFENERVVPGQSVIAALKDSNEG